MDNAEQVNPEDKIAYLGSATQGDLKESVTLTRGGVVTVTTRVRNRPAVTSRVTAAVVLGTAGLALLLLLATGLTPSILLGGGALLAGASGVAAVGVSIYALNRLCFTRRTFEAQSSIDRGSLATLEGLRRGRSDVTHLLLDVAFTSVRLERAEVAAETARERAGIAGSSERLGQVAEKAEEELVQAQAAKKDALTRLVEFTTEEDESARSREGKF